MTSAQARHKDWTTLVREMKLQQKRHETSPRVQMFGGTNKEAYFRELRAAPHVTSHSQLSGQAKKQALARLHYSRNNPHVSISFPFRNGDPLTTYMVWTPHPNHLLQLPPYPPLSERTKTRLPYTTNTMKNVFQDQMKSTYVTEISELPAAPKKYDRNMRDHFAAPRTDERRSHYLVKRKVLPAKLS